MLRDELLVSPELLPRSDADVSADTVDRSAVETLEDTPAPAGVDDALPVAAAAVLMLTSVSRTAFPMIRGKVVGAADRLPDAFEGADAASAAVAAAAAASPVSPFSSVGSAVRADSVPAMRPSVASSSELLPPSPPVDALPALVMAAIAPPTAATAVERVAELDACGPIRDIAASVFLSMTREREFTHLK